MNFSNIFGSKKVIEYRGKLNREDEVSYVWQRLSNREGGVTYEINRTLPQIQILKNSLDHDSQQVLEALLASVERSLPVSSMYLDVADGEISETVDSVDELINSIEVQLAYAEKMGMSKRELAEILIKTEPYSKYESLRTIINAKWSDNE